ncbi:MAG: hypothetical protein KJ726_08055, partial [Verrucomicrobia bacterium]|nr:hypothetical protein [Verrucomicrobiota bacterium]
MKPESALASVKGHLRVSAPALLSVGAGALFMLLLFSETLAPGYDDWMMVHDDPAQHIVGWNFFRFSEWTFPPGLIKNYGPPTGVSISYTDALPLLAFPFKAIAFLLPTRFQYFGIWLLLSYMLQGLFGYLVVRAVTRDDWLGLLGACFFIQSPIMLWRVQFHLALAGHWLVLAGIWLNIRRHERFQHAGWMVVLVMSLLTHPYLALMNIFLMLADALRLWRPARKKTFSRMLLFVAEQTAVLAMAAWLLGLFGAEFQKEGTGYGLYSLNLNALFNPTSYLQNWSRLFPKLGLVYKQRFEGFNYLGLGGMILLFAGVAGTLLKRDIAVFKRQFPLALVCTCLTLLALSHTVAFGEHILFKVPLPSFLMETL